MKRDGKKVTLEMVSCTWCHGTGTAAALVLCPNCEGTGRGPRGGENGCRKCNGMRKVYSHTLTETCTSCNGAGQVPETNCDTMPAEWWSAFDFRVYRQDRAQTYNEYLLAHGCVYSCTDYGAAAGMSDDAIIAKVKDEERFTQLTKVANKDNILCNHIGIFINRDGYSVRAVYDLDGSDALYILGRERGKEDGLRVGNAIAQAGGNGTMGAIYKA